MKQRHLWSIKREGFSIRTWIGFFALLINGIFASWGGNGFGLIPIGVIDCNFLSVTWKRLMICESRVIRVFLRPRKTWWKFSNWTPLGVTGSFFRLSTISLMATDIVSQDPIYWRNTGDGVWSANFVLDQLLLYFPSKNGWTCLLVLFDLRYDSICGHARLGASNCFRTDCTNLIIPTQNFRDTTIRNLKHSWNVTWTCAWMS